MLTRMLGHFMESMRYNILLIRALLCCSGISHRNEVYSGSFSVVAVTDIR